MYYNFKFNIYWPFVKDILYKIQISDTNFPANRVALSTTSGLQIIRGTSSTSHLRYSESETGRPRPSLESPPLFTEWDWNRRRPTKVQASSLLRKLSRCNVTWQKTVALLNVPYHTRQIQSTMLAGNKTRTNYQFFSTENVNSRMSAINSGFTLQPRWPILKIIVL